MNQLGTARLCRSIRLNLSSRTAKDGLRFICRTSHVPNLMHNLYVNVFFNITALLISSLVGFHACADRTHRSVTTVLRSGYHIHVVDF